jgi:hypothetical protein
MRQLDDGSEGYEERVAVYKEMYKLDCEWSIGVFGIQSE